jgi:hypothetical protein
VEFEGGERFSDAQLIPVYSGTSHAPIRFTSYGRGQATLTRGIWLNSIAWLVFKNLRITGPEDGIGSGYGSGARHVSILRDVISGVPGVGVSASNPLDYGWTIAGDDIRDTGDSGVVAVGGSTVVWANQIVHTGINHEIRWAKHGIYSKGPWARIIGNRIVGVSSEGISTRFRDAFVFANYIRGGAVGIGYWQNDKRAGTTVICANTISHVHYGVLLGPQSGRVRERLWVVDNHIATSRRDAVYDPGHRAAVRASANVVTRSASQPAARACHR